jgi:hypothetical protein
LTEVTTLTAGGHDTPPESRPGRPAIRPPGVSVQVGACRGTARSVAPPIAKIVSTVT